MFKIESKFIKCNKKNGEDFFRFWEKGIWKCCNKLRLLRREYFSLAVSGLINSPKIFCIIKRDFFELICLHRNQKIWQRCCHLDFNSVSVSLPYYVSKGPLRRDFFDTYLSTVFRVCKFKNTSAMRVIFFLEMLKSQPKFRKCIEILRNVFNFWDNSIWKCCKKLPLLRREYLSSAVNGLTNSPKIFHISQRNFISHNCLHRDQ